ncbi:MAG: hypothetical protein ACREC6_08225 [Hyphomicrobiaceae bacterium]
MSWVDAWAVSWETWAIAGLVLVILDLLVGGSGNIIALGCACFLMSGLAVLSRMTGLVLIGDWKVAAVEFAAFAAAAVFILRRWSRPPPSDKDVNIY